MSLVASPRRHLTAAALDLRYHKRAVLSELTNGKAEPRETVDILVIRIGEITALAGAFQQVSGLISK